MTINRRRAPSSEISSEKKLGGHEKEREYAGLIGGVVIKGTQKADIKDKNGKLHSVKSGKKWQVFLYAYNRIAASKYLNILLPCQDAFPEDVNQYFEDRTKCIGFKEKFMANHGRKATTRLSNDYVAKQLGANSYMESKNRLRESTTSVSNKLKDNNYLRNFLQEAMFNNDEVEFLAAQDTAYKNDGLFKVFAKQDVLNILCDKLSSAVSRAGGVPEDYNVAGQKTLLKYQNVKGKEKNIVEIEIRNDSIPKYRNVRFNMYSRDTLLLLLSNNLPSKPFGNEILVYGQAIEGFCW